MRTNTGSAGEKNLKTHHAGGASGDDEEPPPLREDYLFLDEEQEELESKYGCPMVELDEDELLEIVEQFVKLTPESAKWEENMQGIKYKYQEECA